MKQKQALLAIISLFVITNFSYSQRRASIEKVDANHKANGSPIIILPQTAVKFDFAMVEFSYTIGSKLRKLITLTGSPSEQQIKSDLKDIEKRYGVNAGILAKLLHDQSYDETKELKISKLDKDIKTSFVSMADYSKVYRYTKLNSLMSSSLLNLVYDENGVLVSSKRTDESKLIPTIISTLSGIAGIAGAVPRSAGMVPAVNINEGKTHVKIDSDMLSKLDEYIDKYRNFLTADAIYNEKQMEMGNKKFEEDIQKTMGELFYSKDVTITPLRIQLIIPSDTSPTSERTLKYELFEYNNQTHKIKYNNALKDFMVVSPKTKFEGTDAIATASAYQIELSVIPEKFDRYASLASFIGYEPDKKTAVFNIPKSERFRFLKPGGTESYIDSVIKMPQHGSVAFLSQRLSSIELTYDANGELKSMIAESKSGFDTNVSGITTGIKDLVTGFKNEKKTELQLLEEKAKMLELLKKINELESQQD